MVSILRLVAIFCRLPTTLLKTIFTKPEGHIEISLEYNDPLPDIFKGEYELEFGLTTEALLIAYNDIFTKAALSRITGINQRQLLPSFTLK